MFMRMGQKQHFIELCAAAWPCRKEISLSSPLPPITPGNPSHGSTAQCHFVVGGLLIGGQEAPQVCTFKNVIFVCHQSLHFAEVGEGNESAV